MNMKKLTYLLFGFSLCLISYSTVFAQDKDKEEEEEKTAFMDMSRYNFYEIQRKADKYFSKEKKKEAKRAKQKKEREEDSLFFSKTPNIDGRPEDNAYHKYKRW